MKKRDWYRDVYLKTHHFRQFKLRILKIRNRCERCNLRNGWHKQLWYTVLDVHHKNYLCLWHETDNDVLVLCRHCHDVEHEKLKGGPKLLLDTLACQTYSLIVSAALSNQELDEAIKEKQKSDSALMWTEATLRLYGPQLSDVLIPGSIKLPKLLCKTLKPSAESRPFLVQ